MLFWVWDLGAGCDMVRSSWLMSYACLYTTRRLQIQLCLIINKIENIKLHKILQKRHWPSLMSYACLYTTNNDSDNDSINDELTNDDNAFYTYCL